MASQQHLPTIRGFMGVYVQFMCPGYLQSREKALIYAKHKF